MNLAIIGIPAAQLSDTLARFSGVTKEASLETRVAKAMTEAGVPRDCYFFSGNDGRATAYFGDWHEKEIWDKVNKIGRKFFSKYEEPDDSEIGRPEWATDKIKAAAARAIGSVAKKSLPVGRFPVPDPAKAFGQVKLTGHCQRDDFGCGPAALMSVLQHFKPKKNYDWSRLYQRLGAAPDGTGTNDLLRAIRSYGLRAKKIPARKADLLKSVSAGRPVLQGVFHRETRGPHWQVVTGGNNRNMYLTGGAETGKASGRQIVPWSRFNRGVREDPVGISVWHPNQRLLKQAANSVCDKCGHSFDSTKESETHMGAVACPKCHSSVLQKAAKAPIDPASAQRIMHEFGMWFKHAPWVSFPWMKNYARYNKLMARAGGDNLTVPKLAAQVKGYIGPVGAALVGSDAISRSTGIHDPASGWGSHMPWSDWKGIGEVDRAKMVVQQLLDKEKQEKSAAEIVKKPRTEYDDHCPHCDHKFHEKGYPRRKYNGESDEDWKAGFDSGDYDEHCPHCDGIVDRRELTDEEIERSNKEGWGDISETLRKQRDAYRKRKAAREQTPVPDATVTKVAAITAAIRKARNETHQHPTPLQLSAGNYKKGRIDFKGIPIAIENPIDSFRRGVTDEGKAWESRLTADYGYVVGTDAADGDAVDAFIGPDHDSDFVVVVDQYKGDTFDESKFILAVTTQEQGEKLYLSNYQAGWKLGPVSTTTVPQFKKWLKDGNHKKPFKGQMLKAAGALARFGAIL